MARIPKAELEKLKQETSLERLVEAKGIKLERHGRDLLGLCPFHNDKSPSLVVSPHKNLWHCLGACQAGGDVIEWVMKAEGVSFRHAVELLRTDASSLAAPLSKPRGGRPPKDGRNHIKHSSVRKLAPVLSRDADDQRLMLQVIDYYHATLKDSPEALTYLEQRGLRSAEMIEHFKLGFANRTLGYRLPARARADGAELRDRLQRLGILRQSGHEHLRGSLVIPIFDEAGSVVEVYGRKIGERLRNGTAHHLYLPGPHRGLFNVETLAASKEIILCEALIDALTFWCAGFRNVTSSYGIEGFTKEHLEAFEKYGTERVLIAYDRDEAGDKAANKLAKKLIAKGLECFRIQFPRGMDANDYALTVEPAAKSLDVAIRSAVWMGKAKQPPRKMVPARAVSIEPVSAGLAEPTEVSAQVKPSTPLAASGPAPAMEQAAEAEVVPPVAASPVPSPSPAQSEVRAKIKDQEVVFYFGPRRWRVRGLAKNMSYDVLRVNLLCGQNDSFHVDTFDLYSAKHRAAFIAQAASELDMEQLVLKKELGRVLLKLEQLQDEQIQAALNPEPSQPEMTAEEREEAMALLKSPELLERILADFELCGVVGEQTNKLAGYLAAVSRKLSKPLAVIIQSSSAAGKSALMDAVLSLMPEEERVQYSAMTGQSLFYMGETDLKHKILAVVEEEGAERASYALKLLQSEGVITIASTGKDSTRGRLVTHEYRVEGPVMIFLTTTAVEIDEELLNRCLILTVDEEREQTAAIHAQQRRADGHDAFWADEDRAFVMRTHQNAQRLLRPLRVLNPFSKLNFLILEAEIPQKTTGCSESAVRVLTTGWR